MQVPFTRAEVETLERMLADARSIVRHDPGPYCAIDHRPSEDDLIAIIKEPDEGIRLALLAAAQAAALERTLVELTRRLIHGCTPRSLFVILGSRRDLHHRRLLAQFILHLEAQLDTATYAQVLTRAQQVVYD